MHYSSGLCTPSDPNLMNARWQHLIILDPRTRLRTLLFVRAIASNSPSSPLYLTQRKRGVGPSQTVAYPPATVQTLQHSTWEMEDPAHPFLSFIIRCKRFRLMTNSILAQIFPTRCSINLLAAHPPRNRIPGHERPMFLFYPTSHRQRRSNPDPLPWRAFIYPIFVLPNSKTGPYSVPSTGLPRVAGCRLNPVNSALTPYECFCGSLNHTSLSTGIWLLKNPAGGRARCSFLRFAGTTASETRSPSPGGSTAHDRSSPFPQRLRMKPH